MQDHFIVEITRTSRVAGRGGDWITYDAATHHFDSIAEARAWIKEQYPQKPVSAVYVDTKSRGTVQTGWIFGRKERGCTQSDWRTVYYLRDWVSIARVTKEAREGKQGECESVDVRKAA